MTPKPTPHDHAPGPPETLRSRLRDGTGAAHEALESALDLLGSAPDKGRFTQVLERFLGFHLAWERAAFERRPDLRSFLAPRSRLPHLRRDLAALGRTNAEQSGLAECPAAASLLDGRARAVGSIYVLEGSTLGGQVIARAITDAGWAPPGGLTYFTPYGARTGEMWRRFGAWAEDVVPRDERAAAVVGAARTFGVLQAWLTGAG
jgi:heme oxygenase